MVGVECDEDGELVWCSAPYAKLMDVGAAPVCAVRVGWCGDLASAREVAPWACAPKRGRRDLSPCGLWARLVAKARRVVPP
jgi:hypothetical protein